VNKRTALIITLIFVSISMSCAFTDKETPEQPNVILIIADTLRPDYLGCYGYKDETSPAIDALSKESVHFSQAVTPIPMTTPAHACLFTGLYPRNTKLVRNGSPFNVKNKVFAEILQEEGYETAGFISVVLLNERTKMNRGFDIYNGVPRRKRKRRRRRRPASGKATRTAEQRKKETTEEQEETKKKEYEEELLHEDMENVHEDFKDYGGEEKEQKRTREKKAPRQPDTQEALLKAAKKSIGASKRVQRQGEKTMDLALEWLGEEREDPFFLWVHLYDNHWPYLPPAEYMEGYEYEPERWEILNEITRRSSRTLRDGGHDISKLTPEDREVINALYAGEVRYVDHQIERLITYLKEKGLYDNSVIIFIADHGETLGEIADYYGHHKHIYEPSIRIPVIMKLPGVGHKEISESVRIIDVMPTLFSYLGIEDTAKMDGIDLLPLVNGD